MIGCLSFAAGCLLVAAHVDRLAIRPEYLRTAADAGAAGMIAGQIVACLALCWPLLFLVSAFGFALMAVAHRPILARLFLVLPLVATTYTVWRLPRPGELDLVNYARGQQIECVCQVESRTGRNAYVCTPSRLVSPSQGDLDGRLLLTIYGGNRSAELQPGQVIRVSGKAYPFRTESSTWQPGSRRRMLAAGVYTRLSADSKDVQIRRNKTVPSESDDIKDQGLLFQIAGNWNRFWESGRQNIIQAHQVSLGDPRGDLLSSMVIGDRVVKLADDLRDLFRKVGLSHLLAASGFNLSIVVASSYFLGRLLPLPSAYASAAALFSTACFVCLASPSPSVVRAALLCVLFLLAKLFSRRLHGLAALSLTLIIVLIVDPLLIADVGLQLSYFATAGIIAGLQWVNRSSSRSEGNRIIVWLRDTVSVICLSQLAILPVQLLCFRTAGLLFLPANLLVDPVVAPITVIGFVSSIIAFTCALLPCGIAGGAGLIDFADKIAGFALDYMIACASFLGSFNGAIVNLGPPLPFAIPVYYLCLIFFLYTLPQRHMRLLGTIVLLTGMTAILFRPNMPGEIVYLSKDCVLSFQDRKSTIISDKKPDWAGKQLLSYSGSAHEQPQPPIVSPEIAGMPPEICMVELKDFLLIAQRAATKPQSLKPIERSGDLIRLLRRNELDFSCSRRRNRSNAKQENKPVLIWAKATRRTSFRRRGKEIYVASVGSNKPLLVSRRDSGLRPLPKGKYFHPFRVNWQSGCVLVLR